VAVYHVIDCNVINLHLRAIRWGKILSLVERSHRQQNFQHKPHIFRVISTDRGISPYACLFQVAGVQNVSRFHTSNVTAKGTSDTYRYCLSYAGSSIRLKLKIMYVATSYASLPSVSHCQSNFVTNVILFNITQS
jgi:hypothetical protein